MSATDLKKGSKGQDVTTWQVFLQQRGASIKPDGDFGPATETATKAFQKANGLNPDGIVGEKTIAAAEEHGFHPLIVVKNDTKPAESATSMIQSDSRIVQINESRLLKIAPVVANRVRQFINAAARDGVILEVVQGLRTFGEQDALYAQGRTRPGKIVTNARGGQSLHNYGLAADLAPVVNGEVSWKESLFTPYNKWDDIAGLEWGGNWKKFKDLPHVQDTEGMNLARVQEIYRQGGLAAVWSKVK